ncbi:fumarate hydratase [bacterium]|nr:fumarate hydratase [bacterium]
MRTVKCADLVDAIADMCVEAATCLPPDVLAGLQRAKETEQSPVGLAVLDVLLENAALAKREKVPICQDTGVAVYFVELGHETVLEGNLYEAICQGTELGYKRGYLRMSIAGEPLFERLNTHTNTPPVVHVSLVPGDALRITLASKGGGSENMSAMAMLKPSDGKAGVVKFILDTVRKAGGNACPPMVVGIGLGGNFEMAPLLAKRALLRELSQPHPEERYAAFEREMLELINGTGIGPQGLGGKVTAMAVHVEYAPCHIASLPVAVNFNCHVARHAVREF